MKLIEFNSWLWNIPWVKQGDLVQNRRASRVFLGQELDIVSRLSGRAGYRSSECYSSCINIWVDLGFVIGIPSPTLDSDEDNFT